MLPYGGQGSNQAIEDAGALGFLFDKIHNPSEIPNLFNIFETVRVKRASRSQVLGSVRVGREAHVKEALLRYADPPGSGNIILRAMPLISNSTDDHDSSARVTCGAKCPRLRVRESFQE